MIPGSVFKQEVMQNIQRIRSELDVKISGFEKQLDELCHVERMPDRDRGLDQIIIIRDQFSETQISI